jgi:hypothetical protein
MEPHLVHHTNSKTAKQVWVFLAHPIVEILRITQLLEIPNFTSTITSLKSIPCELSTLQLNLKYQFIAVNTSLPFNPIHNATQEYKYQTSVLQCNNVQPLGHTSQAYNKFENIITADYNSGKYNFLASRCVKSLK